MQLRSGVWIALATVSLAVCGLAAPGQRDPAFRAEIRGTVDQILVRRDDTLLLGSSRGFLQNLKANGVDDSSLQLAWPDQSVQAMSWAPDGTVYIGGSFSRLYGYARKGIGRLLNDGSLDVDFQPGTGTTLPGVLPADVGQVNHLAVQSDGKVLISGWFHLIHGTSRPGFARLNPDGSVDESFAPSSNSWRVLTVHPDGQILATIWSTGLVRLAPDGSISPGFHASVGPVEDVRQARATDSGRILIAGSFVTCNSYPRRGLARLNANGTLDQTFDNGAGLNGDVNAFALQADGKLLVTGAFTRFDGTPRPGLVRLNSDGALDEGFVPELAEDFVGYALALQSDGKVLCSGYSSADGAVLVRLFGGEPSPVPPVIRGHPFTQTVAVGSTAFFSVRAVSARPLQFQWFLNEVSLPGATNASLELLGVTAAEAGQYHVRVSNSAGVITSAAATLSVVDSPPYPGALDLSFNPGGGANGEVYAVAAGIRGRLMIAGRFTSFNGSARNSLVQLQRDGRIDPGFQAAAGADTTIRALTVAGDGSIGLGYADVPQSNGFVEVLHADGRMAAAAPREFYGGPYHASAQALYPLPGGRWLMVGSVGHPSISSGYVARLHADGQIDTNFTAAIEGSNGAPAVVHAAAIEGNRLLIGGDFSTINGVPRSRLARLLEHGELDPTFDALASPDAAVRSVILQSDGRILIGGEFTRLGEVRRAGIARLWPDGRLDPSFDPGAGVQADVPAPRAVVNSIVLDEQARILAGGFFSRFDSEIRRGLVRLRPDGSVDRSFNPGLGVGGTVFAVHSLALLSTGELLIGGAFSDYAGVTRKGIAMIQAGDLAPAAPVILQQPRDQTATEGQTVLLAAEALSYARPDYQWQLQGVNLPGATNAVLELGKLTSAQAGVYQVFITNERGTVASTPVRLQVHGLPESPGQPDLTFNPGSGPNDRVMALAAQDDGRILIGGAFTRVDGAPRVHVARLLEDGGLDSSFDVGVVVTNPVASLVVQPDGRILVGMAEVSHTEAVATRVLRLRGDGTLDDSFHPAAGAGYIPFEDGRLSASGILLLQPDGKILTTHVGAPLRLNPDGSADRFFTPPRFEFPVSLPYVWPGYPRVEAVALQSDGKILLRANTAGLTRLNPDGTTDWSFIPGVDASAPRPKSLAVQADDKILVWGSATNGFLPHRGLLRLQMEGELDPTFVSRLTEGTTISAVALQPDGKLILSGNFNQLQGVERKGLARLLSDGRLDPSFDPGAGVGEQVGTNFVPVIETLILDRKGRLIAGGSFTSIGGIPGRNLARIITGLVSGPPEILVQPEDTTAERGADVTLRVAVSSVSTASYQWQREGTNLPSATGQALVLRNVQTAHSGRYTVLVRNEHGLTESAPALLNVQPPPEFPGALDASFYIGTGANGPVQAIDVHSEDGRILVGGNFSAMDGAPRNQLAVLAPDGAVDPRFEPPVPLAGSFPHEVRAVAWSRTAKAVAAGRRRWQRSYGSLVMGEGYYVARYNLDGQVDPDFAPWVVSHPAASYYEINGLLVQPDDKVVCAVTDWSTGGMPSATSLFRLRANGEPDGSFQPPAFGGGPNQETLRCLLLQPDAKLLVAAGKGLIRLNVDGSLDPEFKVEPAAVREFYVASLAVGQDGKIYVLGSPSFAGGVGRLELVRLHPNGAMDASYIPMLDGWTPYYSRPMLALYPDGRLLHTVSGGITRLQADGSADDLFAPITLVGTGINVIKLQSDETLLVGGAFTSMNERPINNLARISVGRYQPPVIVAPPISVSTRLGETVSFSMDPAGSGPLTVQWLMDGKPLPGETNLVLRRQELALPMAGLYQVVLSNRMSSVTSAPVGLTIQPAPAAPTELQFVNLRRDQDQFRLTIPFAASGRKYRLEFKNALTDLSWTPLRSIRGNDLVAVLSDRSTNTHRFYRVRME